MAVDPRLALGALPRVQRFGVTERRLHTIHAWAFSVLLLTGFVLYLPFLAQIVSNRPLMKGIHLVTAVLWLTALALVALLGDREDLRRTRRDIERYDAVVLLFGVDLSGDAQALAGGLMVLLASVGYAVGSLFLKHRLRGAPPVGVAASTMLAGTMVLLPFVPFTLPSGGVELQTVGALLALGAGGTGIAFAIYFTLIAEIGPGRASLVAYIAPGFAVLYGVTLLSEPLTIGAILGLILILAGSWVAAEGRWPGRSRAVPAAPLEPALEPELEPERV